MAFLRTTTRLSSPDRRLLKRITRSTDHRHGSRRAEHRTAHPARHRTDVARGCRTLPTSSATRSRPRKGSMTGGPAVGDRTDQRPPTWRGNWTNSCSSRVAGGAIQASGTRTSRNMARDRWHRRCRSSRSVELTERHATRGHVRVCMLYQRARPRRDIGHSPNAT